ncbi:hypothetical protein SCP_0507330 [Sparassis crispa]|uniref:Uncharacterized protein n=1 Tax=Sparassis crispa TaxID=139825 RepID=A0A401GN84_9APHY|nr:hypothetical protein SCP_0507330 [Sparassis crispa]GBE83678.1 hypothetical protein SCP_0507330 [Sparassis crispa]
MSTPWRPRGPLGANSVLVANGCARMREDRWRLSLLEAVQGRGKLGNSRRH